MSLIMIKSTVGTLVVYCFQRIGSYMILKGGNLEIPPIFLSMNGSLKRNCWIAMLVPGGTVTREVDCAILMSGGCKGVAFSD